MPNPERKTKLHHAAKDWTGKKYGYLEALYPCTNIRGQSSWAFKCHACGKVKAIQVNPVVCRKQMSCGCMQHIPTDPYESPSAAQKRYAAQKKKNRDAMPRFNRNLGFQIRQLRLQKGWSQQELARRLKPRRSLGTISDVEAGKRCNFIIFFNICRVLRIPLWEVVQRAENETKNV